MLFIDEGYEARRFQLHASSRFTQLKTSLGSTARPARVSIPSEFLKSHFSGFESR
jgi:hypothetical protein